MKTKQTSIIAPQSVAAACAAIMGIGAALFIAAPAYAQGQSDIPKSAGAPLDPAGEAPPNDAGKAISDQDRDRLNDLIEQDAPVATPGKGEKLAPAPAPALQEGRTEDRAITLVLVGDTGYSPNAAPVRPKGVTRHGRFQTWADTTSKIAKFIDGDLNFLNLETVVTPRNNLARDTKGQRGPFNFRTHPQGVRHLLKTGFNVVSLANNHSMDYGVPGLRDTLTQMAALKQENPSLVFAGVGMNREEASRPVEIPVKGAKVQFSAIGIVTNNLARHRAGPDKPGQIAYRFDSDFEESTSRLAAAPADYRVLSIHYGVEGRVRADARQKKEWRGKAVIEKGIDLVVGHHAHVVRGVERVGDKIIFYGLGNFLHHGTADMSGKGLCRSYGLLAKVHLLPGADGKLKTRAIEAVPLTAMHMRAAPYSSIKASHARIYALNYLAGDLDDKTSGAKGVRFTPMSDGSGLYCLPGAENDPGRIGALCKGFKPAPRIPSTILGSIRSTCAR